MAVERLEHDVAVAELAAAAGLLLVAALGARLLADRLEVRHARLAQLDLDAEAALEPVDRDLDVHLRQAREELLAGLRVAAQDRVGSSSCRRRSAGAIFSSSPFAFGVTAKLITGSGNSICGSSTLALGVERARRRSASSFSFATAPMSPGPNSSTGVCSLPWSAAAWPMRSLRVRRAR